MKQEVIETVANIAHAWIREREKTENFSFEIHLTDSISRERYTIRCNTFNAGGVSMQIEKVG